MQNLPDEGRVNDSRKYTICRGVRKDKEADSKDVEKLVQEILSRSLKISTLVGSGASYGAVPLMIETYDKFKSEYCELNSENGGDQSSKTGGSGKRHKYRQVQEEFEKSNPEESNNLEAFMTWLRQKVSNESESEKQSEYKDVFQVLIDKFEASVREVDYEAVDSLRNSPAKDQLEPIKAQDGEPKSSDAIRNEVETSSDDEDELDEELDLSEPIDSETGQRVCKDERESENGRLEERQENAEHSNHPDGESISRDAYSVKSDYKRLVQGLGESREILARRERTVFDVINLFTTNYDLFHEFALVESGYLYADGFATGVRNYFSAKNYHIRPVDLDDRFRDKVQPINPFFRLFKLHGSVDWQILSSRDSRPEMTIRTPIYDFENSRNESRGSESLAKSESLIKPLSSKYILTQGMPFSDIFREFVNILGEPDSVLFIIGYGFGDEHINNLILNALQRSDFLLYAFVQNPRSSSNVSKFMEVATQANATFIHPYSDESGSGETASQDHISFSEIVKWFQPEQTFRDGNSAKEADDVYNE